MVAEDRSFADVSAEYGDALDVGTGVVLRWVTKDGLVVGAIRDHPRPDDGMPCSSGVFFSVPAAEPWRLEGRPVHTLVSWSPFHLEPSLLCSTCGSHGFVRGGKWSPA